ncbi:MAG TPA: DUF6498-containing protein [Xanthobacteraceae bacterium]|jgi:hypothetical protein|nr:DUF6498-containing protein [Xanthobacteraceae bacterium]
MTDKTDVIDLTGLLRPHYLLHPSTVLLIAADLFPLAGIAFWHWDTFLLLMLYWMDTAVIAFWTVARIAATPRDKLNDLHVTSGGKSINSPWAIAAFFVVHCGLFMAVHFLFLWIMFSGAWSRRIHGPADFVRQIVVESRLWLPLAGLILSRGVSFLFHVVRPELIDRIERALFPRHPVRIHVSAGSLGSEIAMLYVRVVIMQLAIIVGGFLSVLLGTMAPFVILIVLKTAVDVALHLAVDLREHSAPGTAAAAVPMR